MLNSHSNFFREDDTKWPEKNKDGRQELEIKLGNEHISFEVCDLECLWTGTLTNLSRLPKLALWSMSLTRKIPKDCVSFTILFKI